MFAGKTSELLRLGRRHELAGKKVCYVKHQLDCKRTQGAKMISTHDGVQQQQPSCLVSDCLVDLLGSMLEADIICIDEGQFFSDLRPVVNLLLVNSSQKHVIISALNGTYQQQLFPSIAALLPVAETVEWLTAVCFRCGSLHARFTRRLNDDGNWDGSSSSENVSLVSFQSCNLQLLLPSSPPCNFCPISSQQKSSLVVVTNMRRFAADATMRLR